MPCFVIRRRSKFYQSVLEGRVRGNTSQSTLQVSQGRRWFKSIPMHYFKRVVNAVVKESKEYPTLCWDASLNWNYWQLVELGWNPHPWVEGWGGCYIGKKYDKKIKVRKNCLFIGFIKEVL